MGACSSSFADDEQAHYDLKFCTVPTIEGEGTNHASVTSVEKMYHV
jgi:hypothetical protein